MTQNTATFDVYTFEISGFRREMDEKCASFRVKNTDDVTDRLSRNVAKGLPLHAAYSGVPRIFFGGRGGSTNSVENRENGDLGVVAP